ncbi:hypothetical protein V202x_17000 [Gimesia aquarii]|uniref:Uncharacterized protein n=1 Tax=Gimesia aquarii TaxID=2527964 RepID=A0A517WSV5_9PLAN|nr:hypothetical protein V202x_17000 [Gimesia aquarii]
MITVGHQTTESQIAAQCLKIVASDLADLLVSNHRTPGYSSPLYMLRFGKLRKQTGKTARARRRSQSFARDAVVSNCK